MTRERLELALAQIPPSAWEDFEEFASEFLVTDFPNIRTMARRAGDGGRDAEIYDALSDASIKLQYSVTVSWRAKIRATAKVIADHKPKPTHLVYVSNQMIGPEADALKRDILADNAIVVDVRDRSYFLDRRGQSFGTQAASESLERKFVDPLLSSKGIIGTVAPALTADEERIAFLHLSIDLIERDNSRNMTKSAYESLVLAVLHNTTHETSIRRSEIHRRISGIVRSSNPRQTVAQIDSAVARMSVKNGRIKHIKNEDSFHISFKELDRINCEAEKFLDQEDWFTRDILAAIYETDEEIIEDDARRDECILAIKEVIERLLLDYGEQFSQAISTGRAPEIHKTRVEHLLTEMAFKTHLTNASAANVINLVLTEGADETLAHLRRLLDSYTVLALLKSTPDVQKALRKVFVGGQIWLDTSVVLPLMAEGLYGHTTPMRDLMKACNLSDIKLHVTTGVIEEVDRHLNGCVAAARSSSGTAYRVPFLLAEFLLHGNSKSAFTSWQEEFRGATSPLSDIETYLSEEFGVTLTDLQAQVESAPDELRIAAQDYWREVQQRRRARSTIDSADLDRLTAHDVENSVGVVQLRGRSDPGPAGYQHWWLTLDSAARRLVSSIEAATGRVIPSPVMDPNYLVHLLRFRVDHKEQGAHALDRFPVLLDLARMDVIPSEMVDRIEEIRREIPSIKPRLLRRKIRDEVNSRKLGTGSWNEDADAVIDLH